MRRPGERGSGDDGPIVALGGRERRTAPTTPEALTGPCGGRDPRASRDSASTRRSPELAGVEPDPRFTFANERTFLAWNRTALALIGAGLAVAQFVDGGGRGVRLTLALGLIVLGALCAGASYGRWERNQRALRLAAPLPPSRLPRILVCGIAIVALAAAALLVVDTWAA